MAGNHKSGNRPNNKSTKAEIERRIELSGVFLLEYPDVGPTVYCNWAKEEFGVNRDMALKYRKRAKDRLGKVDADSIESAKKIASASLGQMLQKANDKGDVKLALSIRQELNKINGLYTQKIEVAAKGDLSLYKIDKENQTSKEE